MSPISDAYRPGGITKSAEFAKSGEVRQSAVEPATHRVVLLETKMYWPDIPVFILRSMSCSSRIDIAPSTTHANEEPPEASPCPAAVTVAEV